MHAFLRTALLILAFGMLSACGGGGSSDTPGSPTTASFLHVAVPANTVGPLTTLDHPLVNDNPHVYLIVTPVYLPAGMVYVDHPIGVRYLGTRWVIEYADLAAVPSGASFHVTVSTATSAGPSTFGLHTATAGNIDAVRTVIDHPGANDNSSAVILITQNATPGGVPGASHDHPIGLGYNSLTGRWSIFNWDGAAMSAGTAFNFVIVGQGSSSPFSSAVYHVSSAGSIVGGTTYPGLPDPATAILHVTSVIDAAVMITPLGVFYDATLGWGVFRQDGVAMPAGAGFNLAAGRP